MWSFRVSGFLGFGFRGVLGSVILQDDWRGTLVFRDVGGQVLGSGQS